MNLIYSLRPLHETKKNPHKSFGDSRFTQRSLVESMLIDHDGLKLKFKTLANNLYRY